MKRVLFATLCLAASAVYADGQDGEMIDELEVRLSEIEVIDVMVEKSPVASDDELDADIEAILEQTEALEKDDAEE